MDTIEPEGFDFFSPQGYDKILREGRKVLMNILDIEVPMITALNGPVLLHSEYALLTDVVIATPETVFQDKPHFDFGIVPGDGVNLLWPEVIGSIRGRYFILTRQKLDAETAKDWGVVNEIVPTDRLLARARDRRPDRGAAPADRPLHAHRSHPEAAPDRRRRRRIQPGARRDQRRRRRPAHGSEELIRCSRFTPVPPRTASSYFFFKSASGRSTNLGE
jgi:enoyl-CoA hydratase/carnithine racemase